MKLLAALIGFAVVYGLLHFGYYLGRQRGFKECSDLNAFRKEPPIGSTFTGCRAVGDTKSGRAVKKGSDKRWGTSDMKYPPARDGSAVPRQFTCAVGPFLPSDFEGVTRNSMAFSYNLYRFEHGRWMPADSLTFSEAEVGKRNWWMISTAKEMGR